MTNQNGFTLFAMIIIIAMSSMLAVGGLGMYSRTQEEKRFQVTEARMEAIYQAMQDFAIAFERLPCPASLTDTAFSDTYGIERNDLTASDNCTAVIADVNYNAGADHVLVAGMVPTNTLGLDPSYSVDGWNRRITYVVDEDMTRSDDFSDDSQFGDIQILNGADESVLGEPTITPWPAASPGVDFDKETQGAVMALISHGQNRAGGYDIKNGTRSTAGASVFEQDNFPEAGMDGVLRDMDYAIGATANYFDDILLYGTKSDFLLRSSSDAPPPVANCPEGIPGCRMWMDAGHNVTVDAWDNVEEWVGRSDYAVTFTQPNSGNRPGFFDPYPTAQINGAAIHFHTIRNLWMTIAEDLAMFDGITAMTYCSVILNRGLGTSGMTFYTFSSASPYPFTEQLNTTDEAWEFRVGLGAGSTQTSSAGSTTALDTPSSSRDAEVVCHVIDTDADTASTHVNGVQTLNNTSFTNAFPAGSPGIAYLGQTLSGSDFEPVIAEIVYYDRALGTTELNTITTYLTDKHLP